MNLLEVVDAVVEYRGGLRRPPTRALDGVGIVVPPGRTLGVVGESGSGKSTLGNAVLGLVPLAGGSVRFDGREIGHADRRTRRALSSELQVVFQDPYSSLNPVRTIGQTLAEPLLVHRRQSRAQTQVEVARMLERVGLPADIAARYPVSFSGGQRQRIAIARALIVSPKLVICDEAVSALDLSVQAQVLNLLADLQEELGVAYLFISHDLDVVRHVSHRVAVMHNGRIVEEGPADEVYARPQDRYTRMLLASAPSPDPDVQRSRRDERRRLHAEAVSPPAEPSPPIEQGAM